MKRITVGQIKSMHQLLITETGGLDGIRDENLLESSVNSPFQTCDGKYLYPTLQSKAAWLGFSLIKNHPFIDGNKRVGVLAMIVFLEINGISLNCKDDELVTLGLGLADSSINEQSLMRWIFDHS